MIKWSKFGQMAKKAMSKVKKPKGLKTKAQAFISKNKTPLIAGGAVAGTVGGYQMGKKKGKNAALFDYQKAVLASSAKELGYKKFKEVKKLPKEKRKEIASRAAKKFMKQGADYITFYS